MKYSLLVLALFSIVLNACHTTNVPPADINTLPPTDTVIISPAVSQHRYSRDVIDACIYHFKANTRTAGFGHFNADGTIFPGSSELGESERGFDYVPGLVAKGVMEAVVYYQDSTFAAPWFWSMAAYANRWFIDGFAEDQSDLDKLNACKLYFPMAQLTEKGQRFENTQTHDNSTTALQRAAKALANYNNTYRISDATSRNFCADLSVSGGWWHKYSYVNEMWCDGQYMGPALMAQLVHDGYNLPGLSNAECWDIIYQQFRITWQHLWDPNKRLLWHAFSASPADDPFWADQNPGKHYGVSDEYWGRACGWYFLALVDVIELMPEDDEHRAELLNYLNQLAEGLAMRQSDQGCWMQLLQYPEKYIPQGGVNANYPESSATAIFLAAYLKGMRLGFYQNDYTQLIRKGYKGFIDSFLRQDIGDGNKLALIDCCASAGLSDKRKGDAIYYLDGYDTPRITTYTEGKVLGAFIIAAIEYERALDEKRL